MKDYPVSAQIYIKAIIVSAGLFLTYLTATTTFSVALVRGLVFFGGLAVLTDSLPVRLPKGGYVAVTVSVIYAAIVLFGPCVAAYVAIIGLVFCRFIIADRDPLHKLFFNCAQFVIAAGVAGYVYRQSGGNFWDINFLDPLPLVVAAITYSFINISCITLILAFIQRVSPWGMWLTNFKWLIPNMLILPLLGLLMAYVYVSIGPLGVTLFFVPLLLARFIFKSYMNMREIFIDTLEALASSLDAKDKYTRGHSDRVAQYTVELARYLKMPEDEIEILRNMAFLHDVGKIGIRDEILTKEGRLTDEEFDLIKQHPVIGANILNDISYLGAVRDFIRHHHEKYDGTGYPDGLAGEKIPLGARIITLADSFDAMTSDRSYRRGMSYADAIIEVERCAGTHFDPLLAQAFVECWREKINHIETNYTLEVASTLND